jgi:transcriptional regulator with XRE-family HTH domain
MVRRLRQEQGWTVGTLASKAGLHKSYLGQIERCERNPTLLTILRLAHGFKLDPSQLIAGRRAPAPDRKHENEPPIDAVAAGQ